MREKNGKTGLGWDFADWALVVSLTLSMLLFVVGLYHDAKNGPTGIPILLDASCTYWVDQYGNKTSLKAADEYFTSHRKIAEEIVELNSDPLYAPTLYSNDRQQFLENKQKEWQEIWDQLPSEFLDTTTPAERQEPYFQIYQTTMKYGCPSTESLDLLSEYLGSSDSFGQSVLRIIYPDRLSPEEIEFREYDNDFAYLYATYFAGLANFGADGTLTELCNNMPAEDLVPLVLTSNGLWHNKDGVIVNEPAAHEFFRSNKTIGSQILRLNQDFNPYYLHPADSYDQTIIKHELAECQELKSYSDSTMSVYDYRRLINSKLTNLDIETMQVINNYFWSGDADFRHIAATSAEITRLSEQFKVFGYNEDTDSCIDGLFVIALCNTSESIPLDYAEATAALKAETTSKLAEKLAKKLTKKLVEITAASIEQTDDIIEDNPSTDSSDLDTTPHSCEDEDTIYCLPGRGMACFDESGIGHSYNYEDNRYYWRSESGYVYEIDNSKGPNFDPHTDQEFIGQYIGHCP